MASAPTPEQDHLMINLYREGRTQCEAAAAAGFSDRHVCSRALKRHGIETRVMQSRQSLCSDEVINQGSRVCRVCKTKKPFSEFFRYLKRRGGIQSECKECCRLRLGWKRRFHVPQCRIPDQLAAYLGGLWDGEGTIGLVRQPCGGRISWTAVTSIGMVTDLPVRLAREVGIGKVYRRKSKVENWRDQWVWRFCPNACRAFLPIILPHLRLKREQAELVLEYLDLVKRRLWGRSRSGGHQEQAEAIYRRLRVLNSTGRTAE